MITTLWTGALLLVGAQAQGALPLSVLHGASEMAVAPSDGEAVADNVLRIYNVSTFGGERRNQDPANTATGLLPYTRGVDAWGGWNDSETTAEPWQPVVNLIEDVYSEEFEYEGRRLSVDRQGRLMVRGPLALHQDIESLLTFLEDALLARVEIHLERVLLPLDAKVPFGGKSIVSDSEARSWVSGLGEETPIESHRLSLSAGRVARVDLYQEIPVVYDYDVEIAQSIAIADPIVSLIGIGTRIELRGSPAPSGLLLNLRASSGELIGGVRERDLAIAQNVASDNGVERMRVEGLAQDLDVYHNTIAIDTLLQGGKAIVLHMESRLELTARREVLIISKGEGQLPYTATFHSRLNDADLFMVNADFSDPARLAASGRLMARDSLIGSLRTIASGGGDSVITTVIESQRPDSGIEALSDAGGDLSSTDIGHWFVLYPGGGSGDDEMDVSMAQEVVGQLPAPAEPIDVSFTLRRGDGSLAASCSLALLPGHMSAIAMGVEGYELFDYDVEVAQSASVNDPLLHTVFDGLVLWVKPSRSHFGNLLLELRGAASVSDSSSTNLLRSRQGFTFEQSRPQLLSIHESASFLLGVDGPLSKTYGSASLSGGGLTLEVSIQR